MTATQFRLTSIRRSYSLALPLLSLTMVVVGVYVHPKADLYYPRWFPELGNTLLSGGMSKIIANTFLPLFAIVLAVMQSDIMMKRELRSHYNGISSFYERRKRQVYLNILKKSIQNLPSGRTVDLGCGPGIALSWLKGERIGVDFSQESLRRAHRGPDYIVADVEASPFRDESFDVAICLDVIEHVPTLNIIDEAHRIIADGGVFHIGTADYKYALILEVLEKLRLKLPEGPHSWRRADEIVEKMRKAGLTCEQWSSAPCRFYRGTKHSG